MVDGDIGMICIFNIAQVFKKIAQVFKKILFKLKEKRLDMFNEDQVGVLGGNSYQMVLLFTPNGKCSIGYVSGLADCIVSALKASGACAGRRFNFNKQRNVLECNCQMSDETESEAEVCQWIIDVIDKSSMNIEAMEIFVDGKKVQVTAD